MGFFYSRNKLKEYCYIFKINDGGTLHTYAKNKKSAILKAIYWVKWVNVPKRTNTKLDIDIKSIQRMRGY